ncbi:MAG TPA: hypothetical protein VD963_06055 [Phycisphaerales bacterium]|nr:hypothetical protein [Phycisphaerales bacterium]
MKRLVAWLLDLDRLRLGAEGVELGWARPLPGWGWALLAAGLGALAWWSYRSLEGSRRARLALAGLRTGALLTVAVLLSGPRLTRPQETEEKDWVLVLVDRSASMGIADLPGAAGALRTRQQQLEAALEASWPTWRQLAGDRVVVWLGFDAGAYDLAADPAAAAGNPAALESAPPRLDAPAGRRTSLGRALEQALRRAAGRPLAGVVVLSDGRSSDEPGGAVLRRLAAERVPLFSVPLGSPDPVADVAVVRATGPEAAFVEDLVPVEATIRASSPPRRAGPGGRVQLVERSTGLVLDERELEVPSGSEQPVGGLEWRVTLTGRVAKESAGRGRWLVRLVPGGDDLIRENNEAPLELTLEDRPLRVLYLDGYPRWEYRYLKNLLVREGSVRSASMILSPARRYVQEGDIELDRLPASPEEWRRFDVVVLGDVRPGMFAPAQLDQLREHVGVNGAGLLIVAGDSSMPGAWAGTPLADLIPFALAPGRPGAGAGVPAWPGRVVMTPAPAAARSGVLRLADAPGERGDWWPRELADAETPWAHLRWAQQIDAGLVKPAAEVLATFRPAEEPGTAGQSPALLSMRYGAGRVLYVATDETWRWRYGRGERYPERFWLQLVRLLGRQSLARSGTPARLQISPARARVDEPVRVSVELLDQRLVESAPPSLTARVVRVGNAGSAGASPGAGEAAGAELELVPEEGAPSGEGGTRSPPRYVATRTSAESGRYRVEAAGAALGDARLEAEVELWLPDDELLRPETDHALLAALSEATGGAVVAPAELAELGGLIPNRKVKLVGTAEEETLWDTPLALILLLGLLTAEWVGRRLLRLA